MNDAERRAELAHFLRTRRERLSPVQVDLPRLGRRRRTPGLRREELAQIADVSLSWYIKLEQGQNIQVSAQVLESLSHALQLTPDEHIHLFALARQEFPLPGAPTLQRESVDLQGVLDAFLPNPAFVTNERWDVLARNQAVASVFTPGVVLTPQDRNLLWLIFTHPEQRQLFVHWEAIAQSMLALFRMSEGLYREEAWFLEQRDRLLQASAQFRAWWPRHEVKQAHIRRKELNHPVVGSLVLQSATFQVADAPHLKFFLYTPLPEAETASKLVQLGASPKNRRSFEDQSRGELQYLHRNLQEREGIITSFLPEDQETSLTKARSGIPMRNRKVLTAFRRELARSGLSQQTVERHVGTLADFAQTALLEQDPPRGLLDLTSGDLEHYLGGHIDPAVLTSFKRFARFLLNTGRVDYEVREALADRLKLKEAQKK